MSAVPVAALEFKSAAEVTKARPVRDKTKAWNDYLPGVQNPLRPTTGRVHRIGVTDGARGFGW